MARAGQQGAAAVRLRRQGDVQGGCGGRFTQTVRPFNKAKRGCKRIFKAKFKHLDRRGRAVLREWTVG